MTCSYRLFIAFAAEDRYTIAEPLVYHLRNYGVNVWYDRQALLMGDDRRKNNLEDGIGNSTYACIIISKHTVLSPCAMEEISMVKERFNNRSMVVFPVLYELAPNDIPAELGWIKQLIFKEVSRSSGTREICNHIACRISEDLLYAQPYKSIERILAKSLVLSTTTATILRKYRQVDFSNLNSRISLLYAAYISMTCSNTINDDLGTKMARQIFERLFSETRLNLSIDYREIWLLENAFCILANHCIAERDESSI